MNEALLDSIDIDDMDTSGYGEDVDDYIGEDLEDFDGEEYDPLGEIYAEADYYTEEPEDDEARNYSWRRRQALARQRALMRRRQKRNATLRRQQAMTRYRRGYSQRYTPRSRQSSYFPRSSMGVASKPQVRKGFVRVGADVQANRANIQKVDLDSKIKSDALASALMGQQKRITRNEYALAASKVIDEIQTQFPEIKDNKVIKTALPLAPLLFLKPKKRGSGFESVITDPRVWGPLLAAGAALYKETKGDQKPDILTIDPPVLSLKVGDHDSPFSATVRDSKGNEIKERSIKWYSKDTSVAEVNIVSGKVTIVAGAAAGTTVDILAVDTATGKNTTATVTVSA